MKLADLRRLSIRQQIRIRFRTGRGLECVVTEHGVAQVPGLRTIPDFNIEQELASASEFVLEPAVAHRGSGGKNAPEFRHVSRSELASMLAPVAPAAAAAAEHEEE
jgi:hypothetical protein